MVTMENQLLDTLVNDQKNVTDIYKPGPYWQKKALSAIREIKNVDSKKLKLFLFILLTKRIILSLKEAEITKAKTKDIVR